MKISKLVIAPLFIALAFSMSACDRSDWVSDGTSTSNAPASSTSDDSDSGGGMGITYSGKIGTDNGNGTVTPYGSVMPQLGSGF